MEQKIWEEIEDYAKDEKKFLKTFLKLTGGIPSAKTYERVIGIIDSQELNKIFVDFIKEIQFMEDKTFKDIFSFDGKVDQGSARKKANITEEVKPLNVLNVYSDKLNMCIEQELIEEKTNEITGIPEIIKRLDLKGVICTWDALNTQKENVKAVISKKSRRKKIKNKSLKRIRKDISRNVEKETIEIFKILRNFKTIIIS